MCGLLYLVVGNQGRVKIMYTYGLGDSVWRWNRCSRSMENSIKAAGITDQQFRGFANHQRSALSNLIDFRAITASIVELLFQNIAFLHGFPRCLLKPDCVCVVLLLLTESRLKRH